MGGLVGPAVGTADEIGAGGALGPGVAVRVGKTTGVAAGALTVFSAYQMVYRPVPEGKMCALSRSNQTTCSRLPVPTAIRGHSGTSPLKSLIDSGADQAFPSQARCSRLRVFPPGV